MKKHNLLLIIFISLLSCNNSSNNIQQNDNSDLYEYKRSTKPITKNWDDFAKQYRLDFDQQRINLEALRTFETTSENLNTQRIMLDDAQQFYKKIVSEQDTLQKILKKEISEYKADLKKTQKIVYPKFRKVFTHISNKKMWEDDIKVYSSGTTINFVGYHFSLNRNIKSSYQSIASTLKEYRFKRANFKWAEGCEYTYYTIDSPSDDKLIE